MDGYAPPFTRFIAVWYPHSCVVKGMAEDTKKALISFGYKKLADKYNKERLELLGPLLEKKNAVEKNESAAGKTSVESGNIRGMTGRTERERKTEETKSQFKGIGVKFAAIRAESGVGKKNLDDVMRRSGAEGGLRWESFFIF